MNNTIEIKFFKRKNGANIYRAIGVDGEGIKHNVVAIIGQVKDLYEADLIFEDNVEGNEDKWLVLMKDEGISEYDSLDEAKEAVRRYGYRV